MPNNYQEKQIEIVRKAVDLAEKRSGRRSQRSPEIKKIIHILEDFIRRKKMICYGGTAINNILPLEDQFYDKSIEMPDYDVYTLNAMDNAIELADIYHKEGFADVEAKSGMHPGTYKVYVNFMAVADLTEMPKEVFTNIKRHAIKIAGILYTPPNYLRMSMFKELSKPEGDVSRWEKVLKRLILLNKHYPLKGGNCDDVYFQRAMESNEEELEDDIYTIVKNSLIDQGVVFFGGFASSLYSKYMPQRERKKIEKIPDFDVICENAKQCANIVKERLAYDDIKNVKIIKHPPIAEDAGEHYELKVDGESLVFIYEPTGCHSFNVIHMFKRKIRIATIDTMLSYYLSFLFSNRPYYDDNRILCMAQFLFKVQQKNRLEQKGLLRRFSISCYGKEKTLTEMKAERAKLYKELNNERGSKRWNERFMKYSPGEKMDKKTKKKKKTRKHKKKSNKKTKRKKMSFF